MNTRTPRNRQRVFGALVVTAGLALGATACGSDDDVDDPTDVDVDVDSTVDPMVTDPMVDMTDPIVDTTVGG